MLPFTNTSLDYSVRINTVNEVQGRIWGLIGIVPQIGDALIYGILVPLGDCVFIPMLGGYSLLH